ncbi:pantetheine-phosphate adenylyltransferase [Sporolactobacillus sp. KGMB 08714]|uniref:pantetheine-phosphate adenylyltransferase n=1 Tax=Sporolactobacillus sp. KGMB 08714 TaxID=3064704 RepID=UPI002FBED45E
MNERVAIYPGDFDPVTYGHLDIIVRGLTIFDRIIVTVLNNSRRDFLFSVKERVKLLQMATSTMAAVTIDSFNGLLIDYADQKKVHTILRGLRAASDFECELHIAVINKNLNPNIETCFMMTSSKYSFFNSSMVKEAAGCGGSVSNLVPPCVEEALKNKFAAAGKS